MRPVASIPTLTVGERICERHDFGGNGERCFNVLKQCRGLATRYDKTSTSYQATVTIAVLLQVRATRFEHASLAARMLKMRTWGVPDGLTYARTNERPGCAAAAGLACAGLTRFG